MLHCPNGLHSCETSPAHAQPNTFDSSSQFTDWSLLPNWWVEHAAWRWPSSRLPQGRVNLSLSQLHRRAVDCVPTDRRVSLQLVQGYVKYSSMCEEHEHQAGCAGFQTGGCAEVFTWFFLIWGMLELCSIMLLHIFSSQNFHFPESHLLLCSFIFFMYVSPIH